MTGATTRIALAGGPSDGLKRLFVRLGILPFLLIAAIVVFALISDNFMTGRNLINVLRQSVYLMIVSLGQMLALLTGGFDLSVGTIVALSSVVGAMTMASTFAAFPEAAAFAIAAGCFAGVATGTMIGLVNGVGVAFFGVSPFIRCLSEWRRWVSGSRST